MKKRHEPGQIDFVELPAPSVASLRKTKELLQAAFGWTFQDWGDAYADIQGSGLGGGINADSEHRPAQPLVVIYSADLEASRARVVAAGGEIVRDIFSFPGGRRFHFKEPSGNVLAVWSED